MRRAWLPVAGALLAFGCLRDAVSSRAAGRFGLTPVFEGGTAGVVDFDRLRVTLTRHEESNAAVDTTIALAATAESVVVDLRVQIDGQSEDFVLVAVLLDVLGQEVFRAGPVVVTLRAGGAPRPVVATFRYTGTGALAAGVRVLAAFEDTTAFFGDSLEFTAEAFDSLGRAIPGTPIAWASLDSTLARERRSDLGRIVALSQRGVARIEARLDRKSVV